MTDIPIIIACPFCGGCKVSVEESVDPMMGTLLEKTFAWCFDCGAQGPHNMNRDAREAARAWNRVADRFSPHE